MEETIQPATAATITAPKSQCFLILWVLFFFQYAAIGAYFTFLNVYYNSEAGLSGSQIGLMSMLGGIVGRAGPFLWGYVADRTGRPSTWIAAGAGGGLFLAQLIPLVKATGLANPLIFYIAIGMASSLMMATSSTLVDSTCLAMLGERSKDYGRYRMGGSFGYIILVLAVGFIYERAGLNWMFPIYGILMLVFALTALRLPRRAVHLSERGWKRISAMIGQPVWLLLVGTGFLFWLAYNASMMFTGVILKSMGASDSLISFATVIGAVVEVPFMYFSNRLLKRFGPARLLWFAILLQIVRYYLLSRMTNPASAIAINLLNGPGFVLYMVSMINIISRLAPPSLLATAQGFYNSVIGMAGILSSLLSGILFDRVGQSGLFLALSGVCLVAFVLFGLGIVLRRQPAIMVEGVS